MTTAINSTVKFDAFAEEHESLERTLAELRRMLARRRDARAATRALADLSNQVKSHFVHEEQEDGFFDNVIDQAPRLKGRAATLIEEHAAMAEALGELQRYASRNAPSQEWWSELNARFEAFWKLFCRHERAEIDLVQEAFDDDIGPGD